MNHKMFLSDIKTLRDRARWHVREGAVTPAYASDRETVVKLLNEVLATEIVRVLRCKRHRFMAKGIDAQAVSREFARHAVEGQEHADLIAARIVQLGGAPDFAPSSLTLRSHSEYGEGKDLAEMIREDLVAERVSIESYGEIIRYLGENDPTSRRRMETLLEKAEARAENLLSLLNPAAPRASQSRRHEARSSTANASHRSS